MKSPRAPSFVSATRSLEMGAREALGFGVGLRAQHYTDFLEQRPQVDWLEVHSENYLDFGSRDSQILSRLRHDYPVSLHGVGLGLGSARGFSIDHLQRIAALVRRIQPALVSEHLCWGAVADRQLNDLLPMPMTEAALDLLAQRVDQVQEALGRTILIENVSTFLRWQDDAMDEASFLQALARRTGCKILLDVNNLYVNFLNHGEDPYDAMQAINIDLVGEIHLAGHLVTPDAVVDHHGARVAEPVWDLYAAALRRFGAVPTLIEWDTDIPELDVLLDEAAKAQIIAQRVKTDMQPALRGSTEIGNTAADCEVNANSVDTRSDRTLENLQQIFAIGLIAQTNHSAIADGVLFTGESARSGERFALYRGNLAATWAKVLSGAYPVLLQQVGEEFFGGLARAYGRAYPSQDGDLNRFGAGFADFLSSFPHVQQYPHFPDLARIEWAVHRAHYAPQAESLDVSKLTNLPPDQLEALCFSLHPTVTLLHCETAAVDVWLAHQQPDMGNFNPSSSDLDHPSYALIARPDWQVNLLPQNLAQITALQTLADGYTLSLALDRAYALDEEFNFSDTLQQWLKAGLFQALHDLPASSAVSRPTSSPVSFDL